MPVFLLTFGWCGASLLEGQRVFFDSSLPVSGCECSVNTAGVCVWAGGEEERRPGVWPGHSHTRAGADPMPYLATNTYQCNGCGKGSLQHPCIPVQREGMPKLAYFIRLKGLHCKYVTWVWATDWGSGLPEFESYFCCLTNQVTVTSSCLSFLICNMGMIIVPESQGCGD